MNDTVERIRSLAKERGIKQSFLEEKIGAYRGKITEWINGKSTPTENELRIIAMHLGVSVEELRGEVLSEEDKAKLADENRMMFALFDGEKLTDSEMCAAYDEVQRFVKFVAEQKRRERGE